MGEAFGHQLKGWRMARRLSQLDLGLRAEVSARHISFLETGRSRPSREMAVHLFDVLDIPRSARNAMLDAAGFAPAYRTRALDDSEMGPIDRALTHLLNGHMPYPAMVLDRHWTVVRANKTAAIMLEQLGIAVGDRLLDRLLFTDRARDVIVNLPEVARHLVTRLRTESAHLGGDAYLDDVRERLERLGIEEADTTPPGSRAVIPAVYRLGGTELAFFSTISQFGTADDIALADLKIEHLFPANAETERVLRSLVP